MNKKYPDFINISRWMVYIFCGIFLSFNAYALCSKGETVLKEQGMETAIKDFQFCAVHENEETAQIKLGEYYQNKTNQTEPDKIKMLFYYHLAAENGNAHAQVSLAKHLLQMDEIDSERSILISYMKQIRAMMASKNMLFKGEILHPCALLMLAMENSEQKWYYPTTQKIDGEARSLWEKLQLNSQRKKECVQQARLWKQQKMKETAKEVLSAAEYNAFMETVYPKEGLSDAYERSRAIENLKEKVDLYLQ